MIYVTNFQRLHSITHGIILIRVDLSFKKSLFNEMYPNTCTYVTLLLFLEAETINCPHEGCNFFTKFKHILKNHISGKHTNTVSKSSHACHKKYWIFTILSALVCNIMVYFYKTKMFTCVIGWNLMNEINLNLFKIFRDLP